MTAKTKKELANEYRVSMATLRKWIRTVPGLDDPLKKHIFTPLEVFKIYIHLGSPLEEKSNPNTI